jgi:hypothetical protein
MPTPGEATKREAVDEEAGRVVHGPVEENVAVKQPPVVVSKQKGEEAMVPEIEPIKTESVIEKERVVVVREETVVVIPEEPEERLVVIEVDKEPEEEEQLSYFKRLKKAGKELCKSSHPISRLRAVRWLTITAYTGNAVLDVDTRKPSGADRAVNSVPDQLGTRPERQGTMTKPSGTERVVNSGPNPVEIGPRKQGGRTLRSSRKKGR